MSLMLMSALMAALLDNPEQLPSPQPIAPKLKRALVATEAFAIAAADAAKLTPAATVFTRYIWFAEPSAAKVDAMRLALGLLSRASAEVDVRVLAGGAVVAVRLDEWAPVVTDLQTWLDTWELLAFDPSSAELLTKDQITFLLKNDAAELPKVQIRKVKKPILDKNAAGPPVEIVLPVNEVFEFGLGDPELEALRKQNVVRFNGRHIDPALFFGLQQATVSLAPVVQYEYFLWRALTTIKDKGLYADLYGGRYYDFARVRKAQAKKKGDDEEDDLKKFSDLDQLFNDLGLGNNAEKLFNDLRSDQRVYFDFSNVTGKPRVIVFYPGPLTSEGRIPVVMFTIDLANQDIDAAKRQILNLRNPVASAIEVIWIAPNGLYKTAIYDGEGKLLDQVGQDIAADRTIPAPHTPILEPVMGCASCHCASGSNLFIEFTNEFPLLLKSRRGDIFADLGDKKTPISDTLDRLKMYGKKTDLLVTRGREDFNAAVLANTFQRKILQPKELLDIGARTTARMVNDYKEHRYGKVTPQVALRELGFVAETPEQAVATLKILLPPDPDSTYGPVVLEDPFVLRLLGGLAVQRTDWDLRRSYLSYRSQLVLARLPKDDPMRKGLPPIQPGPKKDDE